MLYFVSRLKTYIQSIISDFYSISIFDSLYSNLVWIHSFFLGCRGECDNIGGSSEGTCADGFGVCCIGNEKHFSMQYYLCVTIINFKGP